MPHGPLEGLKQAGQPTRTQRVFEGGMDALLGLLGVGPETKANLFGQMLLAGLPAKSLLHGWGDIKRIASGSGPVRLYHGTTADAAEQIMKRGIQLPESGEAAAKRVADLYGIPWYEWQQRVEPGFVGSGYGEATRKLSTAPYPIAHRWASGFPQGEIYSDLNTKARLYSEAKRRGVPYEDFYNYAGEEANKQGLRSFYRYPEAVGAPDLMKPSGRPGVVLGVDVKAEDIPQHIRREAQSYLRPFAGDPEEFPLRYWNIGYKDIKIDPRKIQNIELVRKLR